MQISVWDRAAPQLANSPGQLLKKAAQASPKGLLRLFVLCPQGRQQILVKNCQILLQGPLKKRSKGGNLAHLDRKLLDSLPRGQLKGGEAGQLRGRSVKGRSICREKGLTEAEDGVAEVDDAVAMGDEDHRVVWEL